MKVLVTGATGFLGKVICEKLKSQGHEVTGLGRNKSKGEELQALGINFCQADLRDKVTINNALKDIDMVIHSGALSSPWGKYQTFYDINVLGSKNIVESCILNKVKRLVHVSTPSVYFNFKERIGVKESDPVAYPAPSIYTQTKLLAEDLIKKSQVDGLEVIIIRPRGLFGPGDTSLIPRLIRAHEEGRLPIIGDGNTITDLTYIDNVADACILSLSAPSSCSGEIYNISNGEPIKLWETVEYILSKLGHKFKRKKVPFFLVYFIAFLQEITCKYIFTDKEPTLTRYTAGLLAKSLTLDITKAKNELGYEPKVSIKEGIERMIEWWKLEGSKGGA
jgi:nucleoside-diphosphate-sugar epimerase